METVIPIAEAMVPFNRVAAAFRALLSPAGACKTASVRTCPHVPGDLTTLCCALLDGLEFHLSGKTHHALHQLHQFLWHRGSVQAPIQRLDGNSSLTQCIDLVEHLDHGASETVEFMNDQGVAVTESIQALGEFRSLYIPRGAVIWSP